MGWDAAGNSWKCDRAVKSISSQLYTLRKSAIFLSGLGRRLLRNSGYHGTSLLYCKDFSSLPPSSVPSLLLSLWAQEQYLVVTKSVDDEGPVEGGGGGKMPAGRGGIFILYLASENDSMPESSILQMQAALHQWKVRM